VTSAGHATHVAGYQTWKSLGRYVKKGEKGIMILAPLFRRRTNESNEAENANLDSSDSRMLTGFRAGGDAAVLLESLELVQRTAAEIIAAITPDKPLPPEGGG
jgi:N-terminal domain of anti-restriction factor ArdC